MIHTYIHLSGTKLYILHLVSTVYIVQEDKKFVAPFVTFPSRCDFQLRDRGMCPPDHVGYIRGPI